MKMPRRLALLCALTLAVAACSDDKNNPNYGGMGNDGGAGLPGNQTDQVGPNGNNADSGIPETRPPEGVNPDNADYSTLANDTVYFDFDKATVNSDERAKLDAVAEWFKANPGHALFLAGHTDKRGTPEYNRALGERRALAVREYLAGLGLPAQLLYTNSYGADRPAVDGDTEEAFAKNRRVEIGVIVQK
jgi:peptidoglycan-associated lipoprotein